MNNIQPQNNNINFGFNYNTHRKLSSVVIKNNFPKLEKYLPEIKQAVQSPDFDETFFYSNSHFYFPKKSLLRCRESFLDFDRIHNARSKYNIHSDNMLTAMKNGNFRLMAEEMGRAKHFLDDMSVGFHVQRGNVFQKLNEQKIHKRFEDYILDNEDKFFKQAKDSQVDFKTDTFDDIFMSVVNYSKYSILPGEKNVSQWAKLAQDSINIAVDASKAFFGKISDMIL